MNLHTLAILPLEFGQIFQNQKTQTNEGSFVLAVAIL